MKGLAVGDLLLPTDKMVEIFSVGGLGSRITEIVKTEFKNKDRGDIRRTWRAVEEHGPEGEPPPEDLGKLIQDAAVLAVHICPVAAGIIDKAEKLKIIVSARGGVENIDVKAATRKGIAVINTPNHNAQAVAEYAIGLMLAETRNIARSFHALKNGVWREYYANTEFIPELNGSTVGILGYGQTGRLVAKKLVSFDVDIIIHDPFVPNERISADGFRAVDFETLLRESDIITVHVRLTPHTQRMLGEKELRMMKPTATIVNTARAGLFDLRALKRALEEKWIYGAAIDVFETEPVPPDYPLLSLDNVTLTNHRAGDTRNAYWKAPLLMGKQVVKLLNGERPDFIVNPEVLKTWRAPE